MAVNESASEEKTPSLASRVFEALNRDGMLKVAWRQGQMRRQPLLKRSQNPSKLMSLAPSFRLLRAKSRPTANRRFLPLPKSPSRRPPMLLKRLRATIRIMGTIGGGNSISRIPTSPGASSMAEKQVAPGRVDWRGADLRGVNMAGINLEGADLRATDLTGANFTASNLRYADLRGATLQAAIFQNASLYGAKMQGVEANQADFRGGGSASGKSWRGLSRRGGPASS